MESGLPATGATGEAGAGVRQFFRLLSRIRGSNLTAQPAPERQKRRFRLISCSQGTPCFGDQFKSAEPTRADEGKEAQGGVWGKLRSWFTQIPPTDSAEEPFFLDFSTTIYLTRGCVAVCHAASLGSLEPQGCASPLDALD